MTRCRHPASALTWNSRDEVFVCRRCGQIIFPTPVADDDCDDYTDWDDALCSLCGGTALVAGETCPVCQGEGYVEVSHG